MQSLFRLLLPLTLLTSPMIQAAPPPLVQMSGSTSPLAPGDVWTVAATLTPEAAGSYELGLVLDTRLTDAAPAVPSKAATCPEPRYCRVELVAGEAFTLTATLQAPLQIEANSPYRVVAWGGAWDSQNHVSGAASLERLGAGDVIVHPAAPFATFAWVREDAAHGAGIVTWSGGQLTKCRSTQCALVSGESSGTLAVPGPAPVDYFWRPIPGDRYIVGGAVATVPAVVQPTPVPVVHERYLPVILH